MATDTESAAPTYDQVIAAWNAQADEYNQWSELGEDEKIEWAVACAKAVPPTTGEPRWYMVNKSGMATLCADREDAERAASDAQAEWPRLGPHRAVQLIEIGCYTPPAVVEPLTADGMKEPKNGQHWRVEWWNESCRMMLPTNKKLDRCQSFKNGTLMFTIKQAAHGIGIKDGDRHG